MRISTGMIYDAGLASMQKRTSSLLDTQQQLSSGRRILKPSDDPVAAARALEVTQSQGVNANQAQTRDNAKSTLGIIDGQLDSAGDLMVRVRELAVQAGNASLSAADRRSLANELRARFEEMVALANARDGTGLFLFGGYQTSNQPFAGSVESGVVYGGDDGARTLRVSASRDLPVSDSGNDVFMRIKNGNGTFVTGVQNEKPANIHTVAIDAGTIANSTNWDAAPANLEIRFWTDAAGGGVATKGYSAASVAAPATIVATPAVGANDVFDISVDGAAAVPVMLTPGAFSAAQVQTDINTALAGAGQTTTVTVTVDANNRLVITSDTVPTSTATPSSVALSASAGDAGQFASLMGTPAQSNGLYSIPGQTFYDVVDAATGNSVFTGGASTAASGGTYTHLYAGGADIPLSSSGPAGTTAFDYGARVVVTGSPASGDKFSVTRTATGALSTSPESITHANTTIDKGSVSDPVKWASSANGQDIEVRFWVDAANVMGGGAGATYYDLVDAASGNSLFAATGTASATGAGGTYTHRYASVHGALTGAVDLSVLANRTVALGVNDTLDLTVDGVARSITIDPAAYATPQDLINNIQAKFNAAAPPIEVTASLNSAGTNLVLVSNSVGGDSSVSITTPASNGATALLGAATSGYANEYGTSATINLKSLSTDAGSFDFGASVVVSGSPVSGDVFTIKGSSDAAIGNGYFVTDAKTTTAVNTGSGVIGAGEVLDAAKWNSELNSRNLEVRFWKDPATSKLYYDLVDKETEKSLFTDATSTRGGSANSFTHAFKAGDSIRFSGLHSAYGNGGAGDFGISVTVSGTPADGDAFKIQPSQSESVFDTLGRMITALESGAPAGTTGNTHLANELGGILTSVSQIEDNFLRVRASIGSRLAEVDDLDSVGQDLDLQYSETLSRLQDLDYADAITRLTRQQMELQAAQASFAKVSQLSLFDYL